jgi:hypothetical protein
LVSESGSHVRREAFLPLFAPKIPVRPAHRAENGEADRQETFAELFAERFGGGTATLINVAEAMPQTREAVRAIMDDLGQKGGR